MGKNEKNCKIWEKMGKNNIKWKKLGTIGNKLK